METIQVNLNKNQFINIVRSLNDTDKLEIYRELKKSLFLNRFNNLLENLKTNELSMDVISKEVKKVRKKRYERRSIILE